MVVGYSRRSIETLRNVPSSAAMLTSMAKTYVYDIIVKI